MDLIEGVGESSSPPRSFVGSLSGNYDVRNDVYARLVEARNEEDGSNQEFRELLDAHFNRLPARYFGLARFASWNLHVPACVLISVFALLLVNLRPYRKWSECGIPFRN